MTLQQELLSLEKGFWSGGADFYRKNLDEKCLVAFTEMASVMSRDEVAATVKDEKRWKSVDLTQKGLLELDNGVAVLTYEADCERANGEHYSAIVSSGYVKRGGQWKMAFHQQTPLKH